MYYIILILEQLIFPRAVVGPATKSYVTGESIVIN